MKRNHLLALFVLCSTSLAYAQQTDAPKGHSRYIQAVDEYCPAPGQFVNTLPAYEEGNTAEDMARKCTEALADNKGSMVTLGAYGGYITFHFDHRIANIEGKADLYIKGNAFSGSGEPGIVMVSKDANRNGLPDDKWYELTGSADKDCPERLIYNYEITYTKEDMQNTPWTDNQGNTGYVERNAWHAQEYFPLWMESPLKFKGTRLPLNASNIGEEDSPYWVLSSLDYGYVDNKPNNDSIANSFDIGWAVDENRNPVSLDCIDFVRVYTAVNQSAGALGETSTEIAGAEDLHLEASLEAVSDDVATFEDTGIAMNADNYYCGDESGEVFDNWGSTGYCCTFTSGKFRFTVNYTPAWASWSGYALSSRSETTYNTLTPDQFNACTGSGYGGTGHFLVVFTFGERIEVLGNPEGEEVKGFYLTNNAYTLSSILNGDSYSGPAFEKGDWLMLTITGTHADGTESSVNTMLADYRSEDAQSHYYLGNWQWVDLSTLGKITSLSFNMTGSRTGDYGLNTPAYFCMDNLNGTPDGVDGRTTGIEVIDNTIEKIGKKTDLIFSVDGRRMEKATKGINIIRDANGHTRKIFIK